MCQRLGASAHMWSHLLSCCLPVTQGSVAHPGSPPSSPCCPPPLLGAGLRLTVSRLSTLVLCTELWVETLRVCEHLHSPRENPQAWGALNTEFKNTLSGFPGNSVVKNPLANAGDTGSDTGSGPWKPQPVKPVCPRAHVLHQEKPLA